MKLFFGCAVLAATLTVKAQTSEALLNYSPNGGGYANGTAGWTFQPLTDISLTALGCLNYSLTNSGAQPIEVGLWAANGTLLASNTITTGSLSLDISHYEFITPVMLASNQLYYLGAFATSGAMDITAYDPQSRIVLGSATMSPEIQLGAGAHSSSTDFSFPDTVFDSPGSAIFAPNFEFEPTPVPVPSTFCLLAGAAFILVAANRRRK